MLMTQIGTEIVLTINAVSLAHGFSAVVCSQASNKTQAEWVFNWVRVLLSTPRDLWCHCPPDHYDTGINTTWVNGFHHH